MIRSGIAKGYRTAAITLSQFKSLYNVVSSAALDITAYISYTKHWNKSKTVF